MSLTDAQRLALLDELHVTRGLWPSMPDGEHLIRGYAEHLDAFAPDEIRAGFRLARLKAEHTYPKVAQVVASCNAALRRLSVTYERPEGDDRVTPCCDGQIVVQTWTMVRTAFSLPFPEGMTVDRFGIWHQADCLRLTSRGRHQESAA